MKAVLPRVAGRLVVAGALVASAACTSSDGGESSASCAYVVEYDGRTYAALERPGFTVGEALGAATVPPCDDTPNQDDDGSTPLSTTAYAIEGRDPGEAIWISDASADVLFMAVGRRPSSSP
ncbi:DUF6281 family protein [Streptomyces aurantiogriseus]|uniref:Lipoprotein n=1 Tax=Streptomyces aurantiogriseus TaxID=66870 RepID=A0A918KXG0_9ACTN|nr:DUF6281 family protein [Streptomyces aurantiogriseus]GGR39593.1 hypothetical protein GCM10010251_65250 [Streptomyces aurantiogriseus]